VWPEAAAWEALLGGDDYELLFVVPRRRRRAFVAAMSHGRRVAIARIGCLLPSTDGRRVRQGDGSLVPLPPGYEHFA
jgi:thiamine monophosphate kinase